MSLSRNPFAASFVAPLTVALIALGACDAKPKEAEKVGKVKSSDLEELPEKEAADPVDITSAKADADTWMELESESDGFKARFPVAPKKQDMSVPTPAGTMPAVMYMAETNNEAVGLTVLTVPQNILDSGDFSVEGGLDGARDGMINNVGGTIVSEKHIQFAGHDTRAVVGKVEADGMSMQIEARLLWVKPRMYQLISVTETGNTNPPSEKFFAAFELMEVAPDAEGTGAAADAEGE